MKRLHVLGEGCYPLTIWSDLEAHCMFGRSQLHNGHPLDGLGREGGFWRFGV